MLIEDIFAGCWILWLESNTRIFTQHDISTHMASLWAKAQGSIRGLILAFLQRIWMLS